MSLNANSLNRASVNGACHPDGHFWNYCPGTQSWVMSTTHWSIGCNLQISCSDLTDEQDISLSYGEQGDISCCEVRLYCVLCSLWIDHLIDNYWEYWEKMVDVLANKPLHCSEGNCWKMPFWFTSESLPYSQSNLRGEVGMVITLLEQWEGCWSWYQFC